MDDKHKQSLEEIGAIIAEQKGQINKIQTFEFAREYAEYISNTGIVPSEFKMPKKGSPAYRQLAKNANTLVVPLDEVKVTTLHEKISLLNFNLYLCQAALFTNTSENAEFSQNLVKQISIFVEKEMPVFRSFLAIDTGPPTTQGIERALTRFRTTENSFMAECDHPGEFGQIVKMVMQDPSMTEVYVNLADKINGKPLRGPDLYTFLTSVNLEVQENKKGNAGTTISLTQEDSRILEFSVEAMDDFCQYAINSEHTELSIYELYDKFLISNEDSFAEDFDLEVAEPIPAPLKKEVPKEKSKAALAPDEAEVNMLRDLIDALKVELEGVRQAIVVARAEHGSITGKVSILTDQAAGLEARIERLMQREQELEISLERKNEERRALNQNLDKVRGEIKAGKSEAAHLKKENDKLDRERGRLEAKISETTNKQEAESQKLRRLELQSEQKRVEVDEAKARLENLELQMTGITSGVNQLRGENKALTSEKARLQKELSGADKALREKQKELGRVNGRLEAAKEELRNAQAELKNVKAEKTTEEGRLREAKKALGVIEREMSQAKVAVEKEVEKLEGLKAEFKELDSRFSDGMLQLVKLKAQAGQLREDNESNKASLKEGKRELQELNREKANVASDIKKDKRLLEEALKDVQRLESIKDKLEETIHSLEDQSKVLQAKLLEEERAHQALLVDLTEKIEGKAAELGELEEKGEKLGSLNAELEVALSNGKKELAQLAKARSTEEQKYELAKKNLKSVEKALAKGEEALKGAADVELAKAEVESLKAQALDLNKRVKMLGTTLKQMQKEQQEVDTHLVEVKKEAKAAQLELKEVVDKVAQKGMELKRVEHQYSEIYNKVFNLEALFAQKSLETIGLESQLDQTRAQIKAEEGRLDEKIRMIESREQAVVKREKEADAKVMKAEGKVSILQSDITSVEGNLAEASSSLDEITQAVSKKESELDKLSKKETQMAGELLEVETKLNASSAALDRSKAELEKVSKLTSIEKAKQKEMGKKEATLKERETALAAKEKELYKKQNTSIEEMADIKVKMQRLMEENKALKERSKARDALQELDSEKESLVADTQDVRVELEELLQLKGTAEDALASIEGQVDQSKLDLEKARLAFSEEAGDLDEDLRVLTEAVHVKSEELDALIEEEDKISKELSGAIADKKEALKSLDTGIATASQSKAGLEKSVSELEKKLKALVKEEAKELNAVGSIEELKAEITDLKTQLKARDQEIVQSRANISKLESELEETMLGDEEGASYIHSSNEHKSAQLHRTIGELREEVSVLKNKLEVAQTLETPSSLNTIKIEGVDDESLIRACAIHRLLHGQDDGFVGRSLNNIISALSETEVGPEFKQSLSRAIGSPIIIKNESEESLMYSKAGERGIERDEANELFRSGALALKEDGDSYQMPVASAALDQENIKCTKSGRNVEVIDGEATGPDFAKQKRL